MDNVNIFIYEAYRQIIDMFLIENGDKVKIL